jgi:hypothetical protein
MTVFVGMLQSGVNEYMYMHIYIYICIYIYMTVFVGMLQTGPRTRLILSDDHEDTERFRGAAGQELLNK